LKDPVIFQALNPVILAFDAVGIAYQIVGSVASSAYGIARATLGVDITVDMNDSHVRPLVERLRDAYYIDEDRVHDATVRRSSFNAIHLESMVKVDIFVLKSGAYDRAAFARRRLENLGEGAVSYPLYIASPEDIVLGKLDWYRKGGQISEQQWNDVVGLLKVQHALLDWKYIQRWAETLGLSGLLTKALNDSGVQD
jgi:hypothetical protein